ncbi:twin-arginine translocase TatA/TatE family subunit [Pedobacter frigoris]|uniref:Sec-independent protein translocase protein TatA n=1 Tax=Pedobacter frigoris TaxID=2571272 RepID=A0A4U1CGC4_9SPHI|nr:twin-arginine translocase TatA/TatE family subunit [Pedobacter frigoris]TKC04156.1 twin-arginine translocase TatA/TatE family subunit [Pedobacter frigoris]
MYTGTLADFMGMGGPEVMLIMVVILLLFGGKKLPELARGLGKGMRDFKDASEGVKREIHRNINSVGIVDDVKDMVSDVNDNLRHHPGDTDSSQEYSGTSYETDEPKRNINFEKEGIETADHSAAESVTAHDDYTENTKIETDKTKL